MRRVTSSDSGYYIVIICERVSRFAMRVMFTEAAAVATLSALILGLTLPVGVALYVVSNIARISFERRSRAIVPFLIPLLVVLSGITLWPHLTTWLPRIPIGK